MKKPVVAAALSFVVPGAGLWYFGRRAAAVANLLIAALVPIGTAVLAPEIGLHYVLLAIAVSSAAIAHACGIQSLKRGEES